MVYSSDFLTRDRHRDVLVKKVVIPHNKVSPRVDDGTGLSTVQSRYWFEGDTPEAAGYFDYAV